MGFLEVDKGKVFRVGERAKVGRMSVEGSKDRIIVW